MICGSEKRATHQRVRDVAVFGFVLSLFLVFGAANLAAQSANAFVDLDKAYKFLGNWARDTTDPRGNCGDLKDERGRPLEDCSIPIDQLPLNSRAAAWLRYVDKMGSSVLADCAAITVVNLLGDVRPFNISTKSDETIINYEHANIRRDVWMDGRGHPPPTDLFYHGHSTGRFDGDDLVIDSTNYTFDPDGLDDHANLPTSPRKHLIERYSLPTPSTMKITITIDDPTFLSKPFTFVHMWKKLDKPLVGWWECDPDITRRELQLTYPQTKYPADDR